MLKKAFMEQISNEDGYVSVMNIAGRKIFEAFEAEAESTEDRKKLLGVADRIYITISEEEKDIPEFDTENIHEGIRKRWDVISDILNYKAVERVEEEFPIFVDIFRFAGIVFAFELKEKQHCLENALDYMVEKEDYETAAEIKSILQEMNSSKIQ